MHLHQALTCGISIIWIYAFRMSLFRTAFDVFSIRFHVQCQKRNRFDALGLARSRFQYGRESIRWLISRYKPFSSESV